MMILSVVLENCIGSAVGNPIATDLTGLISGAASFETSSLSILVEGLSCSFALAIRFSDKIATASVRAASRITSPLLDGKAFPRSVLETAIFRMTVVARPIKHNKASQTVLIACGATMPIAPVPTEGDKLLTTHEGANAALTRLSCTRPQSSAFPAGSVRSSRLGRAHTRGLTRAAIDRMTQIVSQDAVRRRRQGSQY